MNKKLLPTETGYTLTLTYALKGHIDDFWSLLATTSGLQKWFPELTRQENSLRFLAGQSDVSLAILKEEKASAFAFDWFGATNTFIISKNDTMNCHQISFTEEIPSTFEHASRDLAGWYNQNHRLMIYANTGHLPNTMALYQDSQDWINNQLRKKR